MQQSAAGSPKSSRNTDVYIQGTSLFWNVQSQKTDLSEDSTIYRNYANLSLGWGYCPLPLYEVNTSLNWWYSCVLNYQDAFSFQTNSYTDLVPGSSSVNWNDPSKQSFKTGEGISLLWEKRASTKGVVFLSNDGLWFTTLPRLRISSVKNLNPSWKERGCLSFHRWCADWAVRLRMEAHLDARNTNIWSL